MTTVINGSSPSITFSDSTTQSTAALPLTGGTVTGGVNLATSSGNVGIGTASPIENLSVTNATRAAILATGGTVANYFTADSSNSAGYVGTGSAHPLAFITSASERMRIDSSGNVGIGTSTFSNEKLAVSSHISVNNNSGAAYYFRNAASSTTFGYVYHDATNMSLQNSANGYLNFATNNTERMRIDSLGNVGIATTAGSSTRLNVKSSTSDSGSYPLITINSSNQNIFYCRSDGYVACERVYSSWTTGNAASVWMDSGGGLYRSTSSIKYKKNVVNTDKGLADVLKLRAVLYEGKSEVDAGKTFGGLIAEEVAEAGLTEFVQYGDDGEPEGLNYGPMVSLAFKAIQELKAELDATKAEVAALKAK